MKYLKHILALALAVVSYTSTEGSTNANETVNTQLLNTENAIAGNKVAICTGPKAVKYHSKSDCRGLNRCSGSIRWITLEEAQKRHYKPCKICC